MTSIVVLKRRINSIKGTRQITKALQLVAASKMKKAQEYAARSRSYSDLAFSLMQKLSGINELKNYVFFKVRPIKTKLYIVISSNSGLAGAYNSNIQRFFSNLLKEDHENSVKVKVIAIGNKAAHFARRIESIELLAVYNDLGEQPTANDVRPILNSLIKEFLNDSVDQVDIIYTKFISNITQQVDKIQVLPASTEITSETDQQVGHFSNFEPDVDSVINEITTRLIEARLWQSILESYASEHSMRMMAMKNATDNAKDLIDDYTLELNTARQAGITQELAEISGGVEAMKS